MTFLVGALGVVVGAAITAWGTYLVTRLRHRHEHEQWLRAERLHAYAGLLDALDVLRRDPSPSFIVSDWPVSTAGIHAAVSRVLLVGPESIRTPTLNVLVRAAVWGPDDDLGPLIEAEDRLLDESRAVLEAPPREMRVRRSRNRTARQTGEGHAHVAADK